MVELVEYAIVFGISAGLAGACVLLVNGALPGLEQVAAASKSDQVVGAARIAAVEGRTVPVLLQLQDASVSCAGGTLSVAEEGAVTSYPVGFPCSFAYSGLDGLCTLDFSAPADSLLLAVTC